MPGKFLHQELVKAKILFKYLKKKKYVRYIFIQARKTINHIALKKEGIIKDKDRVCSSMGFCFTQLVRVWWGRG